MYVCTNVCEEHIVCAHLLFLSPLFLYPILLRICSFDVCESTTFVCCVHWPFISIHSYRVHTNKHASTFRLFNKIKNWMGACAWIGRVIFAVSTFKCFLLHSIFLQNFRFPVFLIFFYPNDSAFVYVCKFDFFRLWIRVFVCV